MKNNNLLILCGILTPLVFWSTLFIGGSVYEGYSHLSNLVSEQGSIGSPSQYVFLAGMLLTVLLSVLFARGSYKVAKQRNIPTLPLLLLLSFSISLFGAALFPLPLRLHGILGMPSFLMPFSPLLALFVWKKSEIKGLYPVSLIALVVMLSGFLIYAPGVLEDSPGLKQRFFHMGWSFWFIYLSTQFFKKA